MEQDPLLFSGPHMIGVHTHTFTCTLSHTHTYVYTCTHIHTYSHICVHMLSYTQFGVLEDRPKVGKHFSKR